MERELQDLLQILGDEALQTLRALAERKRQARAQTQLSEIAESVKDKVGTALRETGFDSVSFIYRKVGEEIVVDVRFVRSAGRSAETSRKPSTVGRLAEEINSIKISAEGTPILIYKDGRAEPTTWTYVKDNVLGWTNRANSTQIRKALRARGLLVE